MNWCALGLLERLFSCLGSYLWVHTSSRLLAYPEMDLCCLSLSVFMFKGAGHCPRDWREELFCFQACEVLADFISDATRALKETLLAGGRRSLDSILPLCLAFKGKTCHSSSFCQRNFGSVSYSENVARSQEQLPPLRLPEIHPSVEVWLDGKLKALFLRVIVGL